MAAMQTPKKLLAGLGIAVNAIFIITILMRAGALPSFLSDGTHQVLWAVDTLPIVGVLSYLDPYSELAEEFRGPPYSAYPAVLYFGLLILIIIAMRISKRSEGLGWSIMTVPLGINGLQLMFIIGWLLMAFVFGGFSI